MLSIEFRQNDDREGPGPDVDDHIAVEQDPGYLDAIARDLAEQPEIWRWDYGAPD